MMTQKLPIVLALLATPAMAEDSRQLDSHEHGVGELNIAVDGQTVAMELHAPGADIVGFEYEATSDADKAAIEAAVATLAKPLDLFVLPAAAECTVTQASASLEGDAEHDDHDDHDHEEGHDDHDDHDHDDHAGNDDHGDDHAHEEHDDHDHEKDHDDHDHDDHADHDDQAEHDDHDDHDHAEGENHTEFHAEYMLTCAHVEKLSKIDFAYFSTFENALELEVQVVTSSGAKAFEVERDNPTLDLSELF